MKPKSILIKKYENRRLYDTTNSRYVNLDEVAAMLQNGNDIRVVDAASGEEITRLILTQIIVEDAKAPNSNFPIDVLRQMVIASGRASQDSALKYMKTMLDMYQTTYRAMSPPVNPFDFIQHKDVTIEAPQALPVAPETESYNSQAKSDQAAEVDELKQRLAQLEALVSKIAPKRSSAKK